MMRALGGIAAAMIAVGGCTLDDIDREGSAIVAFTAAPSAATVSSFSVEVTGSLTLDYTSSAGATLEITTSAGPIHSETFDTSASREHAFGTTIALPELDNDIQVLVRYDGEEVTQDLAVTVAPSAPSVTFPTWTDAFTQSGNAIITVPAPWVIDRVLYAVEDDVYQEAASAGNDYTLDLVSLDIGDSLLRVKVEVRDADVAMTYEFADTVAGIVPVFDCSTPASSMVPTAAMIQDNNFETRTMVGYFGDPDGGHTYTFSLGFNDDGDPITVVGDVITQGRESITVQYNVDRARCGGNPCAQNYSLELFVDGATAAMCSNATFGTVTEL